MRPKKAGIAALACITAIVISACGSSSSKGGGSGSSSAASAASSSSGPLVTIKYGISGDLPGYWHLYAGQQLGIWQKNGLNVQEETVQSGSATDLLALLVSGGADIVDVLPDPALAATVSGQKLSVLNFTAVSPYSMVARKGVTSYDQLKTLSKVKVGVSSTSTATAGLSISMLTAAGIPASQIQLIVTGGSATRLAALQSGAVDVALLTPPDDSQPGLSILGSSVTTAPWYGVSDVVEQSDVQKNCATYKKFYTALREIHTYLVDPANKQSAIQILMKGTKASETEAEGAYTAFIKDNAMPGVNDPKTTLTNTAQLLSLTNTKAPADPASIADTSCV